MRMWAGCADVRVGWEGMGMGCSRETEHGVELCGHVRWCSSRRGCDGGSPENMTEITPRARGGMVETEWSMGGVTMSTRYGYSREIGI